MIVKGYWPWLPFFVTGFVLVIRERRRDLYLLIAWIAVVFVLCSVTRSRILRYMLPAFPAFAMLSAIGLAKLVPDRYLRNVAARAGAGVRAGGAARRHPPAGALERSRCAADGRWPRRRRRRPGSASSSTMKGQPRWDETNQLQWYGERHLIAFLERSKLDEALQQRTARVFVVDKATYDSISGRVKHEVVAASGHLVCFRLADSVSSQALLFGGT